MKCYGCTNMNTAILLIVVIISAPINSIILHISYLMAYICYHWNLEKITTNTQKAIYPVNLNIMHKY